jgi:hypothetical protein
MVNRLEALRRRAFETPGGSLGEAWEAFAAELETELSAFEREVSARAHRGTVQRAHAHRVAQDHAAARELIGEIGRQLARRRPRMATFDLLAELLRGCEGFDSSLAVADESRS